jgi:hypothetical protein
MMYSGRSARDLMVPAGRLGAAGCDRLILKSDFLQSGLRSPYCSSNSGKITRRGYFNGAEDGVVVQGITSPYEVVSRLWYRREWLYCSNRDIKQNSRSQEFA